MHSALSALVLSLPLAALARVHADSALHRRHTAIAHSRRNAYQLTDHFQGQSFFDDWEFFSQADPTGGYVNFLDQQAASQAGLAYVQSDNTTVLAVDDTTQLSVGQNRNSVRISSKKSWNGGLFIADFFAMPHGCSVWPAIGGYHNTFLQRRRPSRAAPRGRVDVMLFGVSGIVEFLGRPANYRY